MHIRRANTTASFYCETKFHSAAADIMTASNGFIIDGDVRRIRRCGVAK